MSFLDAIKAAFNKYADFNGTATRPEFWWWVLFTIIASMVLGMAHQVLSGVFSLATLVPSLAVGARRLHDIDKSGWWQLLGFIPIIGWLVLIYWCAQPGKSPNRFSQ